MAAVGSTLVAFWAGTLERTAGGGVAVVDFERAGEGGGVRGAEREGCGRGVRCGEGGVVVVDGALRAAESVVARDGGVVEVRVDRRGDRRGEGDSGRVVRGRDRDDV